MGNDKRLTTVPRAQVKCRTLLLTLGKGQPVQKTAAGMGVQRQVRPQGQQLQVMPGHTFGRGLLDDRLQRKAQRLKTAGALVRLLFCIFCLGIVHCASTVVNRTEQVYFYHMPITSPLPAKLLNWYDAHGRSDLPWRSHAGRAETAYHTWISEIMLQQTTVAAVIPYYHKFLTRWPTVEALAQAPLDDVLHAWAGLGYYARARNLHKCAQVVTDKYHGLFPAMVATLKDLPGIGDYTANAIAAIAFDKRAVVVDGNIERVMSRVFCIDTPVNQPAGKKIVAARADTIWPQKRSGDFAQALMDLGAMVCTPKNPHCLICPWQKHCGAFQTVRTAELPVKIKSKVNKTRYGITFVLRDTDNRILLQQRPASGLLGGLWETPSTPWTETKWTAKEKIQSYAPALPPDLQWQKLKGSVRYVFSHFPLELTVYTVQTTKRTLDACGQFPDARTKWFKADTLPALSNLMNKVLQHAAVDVF